MDVCRHYISELVTDLQQESGAVDAFNHVPELVFASFVFFMTVYLAAHLVSQGLSSFYRSLTFGQQVDWCTRITSTVHALIAGTAGFTAIVFGNGDLIQEPFHAYSTFAKMTTCVSVGYFFADLVVIVKHFWVMATPLENAMYMLHHVLGAVGMSINVYISSALWFAMFKLMTELSTPFVSCHMMLTSNKPPTPEIQRSPLYLVNGICLVLMFLSVRIIALPVYWYEAVLHREALYTYHWALQALFLFTSVTVDVMNIMWFSGVVIGAKKYPPTWRPWRVRDKKKQ